MKRNVYIETYGCQMNESDSEIVASIVSSNGYGLTEKPDNADVIFLNTCSVRGNAEKTIMKRLQHLRHYKKKNDKLVVGILGCMAERLRKKLVGQENLVSIVVGPDEYRRLPSMIDRAMNDEQGIAVKLNRVETYDDIEPLRTEGINAWISIMRGCDKFCTFCVVPFTRGRERSRTLKSIAAESQRLWDSGIKEVTLLGQNVNSYKDPENELGFPDLLASCAEAVPEMRIRYTTSHPIDMSDKLIETMAQYDNICEYIHLPVQSGSNRILQKMNRHYDINHYMGRLEKIKELMPNCALSTDIIAGFPTETEEDHQATLEVMRQVRYDGAFMFQYSPRENTKAWKMEDDVPDDVKKRRLSEIIRQQNRISGEINRNEHGNIHEVLVEGPSKKNEDEWQGRSGTNKTVVFPNHERRYKMGDYVKVRIERSTSATLIGDVI